LRFEFSHEPELRCLFNNAKGNKRPVDKKNKVLIEICNEQNFPEPGYKEKRILIYSPEFML